MTLFRFFGEGPGCLELFWAIRDQGVFWNTALASHRSCVFPHFSGEVSCGLEPFRALIPVSGAELAWRAFLEFLFLGTFERGLSDTSNRFLRIVFQAYFGRVLVPVEKAHCVLGSSCF